MNALFFKVVTAVFLTKVLLVNSPSYAQTPREDIINAGLWGSFSVDCASPATPSQPNTHKLEFMFVEDRFVQRIFFDDKDPKNYRDREIKGIRQMSTKDTLATPPVDAPLFEYTYTERTTQGERDFVTVRRITPNEHKVWESSRVRTPAEIEANPDDKGAPGKRRLVPLVVNGKALTAQGQPGNDVPLSQRCDKLKPSDFGKTTMVSSSVASSPSANTTAAPPSRASTAASRRAERLNDLSAAHGSVSPAAREAMAKDAARLSSSQYLAAFNIDCASQGQDHAALCLKPEVRERANRLNQLFKQIMAHPRYTSEVLKEEPQWERYVKENVQRTTHRCSTYECYTEALDAHIKRLTSNLAQLNGQEPPRETPPPAGTVPALMRGEYGNGCDLRFTPNTMEVLESSSGNTSGIKNPPNRRVLKFIKVAKVDKEPGGTTIVRTEGGQNYYFYTSESFSGATFPVGATVLLRLDFAGTGDKKDRVSDKTPPLPSGARCEPHKSATLISR